MMRQVFLSLCGKSNILHPSIPTLFLAKLCSSYLGKWKLPQGYDTGITVYNSAVNKRVPLILRDKGIATWYICGPTVYAESHIGHASCYVKFDIIRRIMENIFGINVLLLMGITDIDDKIIKEANKVGKNVSQVSKKYELDFFNDMAAMQIKPPSIICRVTDNIPLIISFCERLISKGYAYVTDEGNVYFMVSKGISADILSNLPEDCQLVTDPLKKDQRDFAVWKAAKPDEPYWLSPWGKGRPGWHIECSAMASHIFGSQLDLHSGGYDLLFPHHANEKSQSEAFHGCSQWVNYWMHSGLLQIDDSEKMSKSLKNTISIKDYLKENSVNDFRILCLQSLYRKNISYNAETLAGAKGLHKKLHSFINDCELYVSGMIQNNCVDHSRLLSKLTSVKEQVTFSFSKDFNTSQALLNLVQLIDEVNRCLHCSSVNNSSNPEGSTAVAACASYVDSVLEMLGVNIICKKRLSREFVYQVDAVVEFRNEIRLLALSYNKKGAVFEYLTYC
ncbi:probable cysteine--tRNA ligase, mitochondrial isoform X2 [Stegodyphus dumicola]|uniref:probable cysteine--tRNA ligase, mitochondrial isoform X2 n=1 Tax=Stegodyphus dumicola TaxID=202533 RepID=UPI0015B12202|nr:probable cysteine--tRNA ligase, mitochondrial isoform X2 [Stegodyphus dumicola]